MAISDVEILVESESLLTCTQIYINPWEHIGVQMVATIGQGQRERDIKRDKRKERKDMYTYFEH